MLRSGHGLDMAMDIMPDTAADNSRLNRDEFADNRALKIQGVRRPPSSRRIGG